MPLIQLLEVLIVVGVLLWLVNRFIPMQGSIKSILNGVVVIAVVLWLLNVFGLFHSLVAHPCRNLKIDVRKHAIRLRTQNRYTQYGRNLPLGDAVKNNLWLAVGITLSLSAFGQTNSQTNLTVEPMAHTPTFRVTVVSRSVQAVNYNIAAEPPSWISREPT